ncbi:uncharacterized protein LOC107633951 [Arachis ipaensis]|uniref:uncharacterized protein LOC107633951 n=1 Tax=Arachis ipaensis TaxID=130454 RepID=UPI000A2B6DEB|nr:uncharacterized protein LOC107633951 [Arachis ipaensis]
MEGTANIVIYHNSEVIRNTYEGVSFACENMFLFVVPCTITFVELQYRLCQSIEADIVKRVTNSLYKSPVVVFGGLIQFEQTQVQHPRIELYVEFEHIIADEVQHDPNVQDDRVEAYLGMNDDNDKEFEATYEAGDEDEDDDGGGEVVAKTLVVPSARINERQICFLIGVADPEDGEFRIGMEYGLRKSIIAAIRSYTISRGVDYVVYESESQMFYAKCKTYGRRCDWLIRASLIQKKACWEIQRYNGRHTCSMGTISQDHSKLDSDTIVEDMKPLVESDPSIKVKSIIVEVQARFNYTISYRKAWLTKQKSIAKIFGGWEESYQALPLWFLAMVQKMPGSQVQIETRLLYNGSQEVDDIRILHRVFWSFNPCIRAFKYCKPLVQVDGTHLYGKYKGCLLVAVAQYGNKNIISIAFAIVEGETANA